MERELTVQERSLIRKKVQEKYVRVAKSPEGCFNFPTGKEGLEKQRYPSDIIHDFPEPILDSFCGVGNPFNGNFISQGEAVLDIGCGSGLDAFVAAKITGPQGRVIGLDLSPEMINKAKENLAFLGLSNVSFEVGEAEALAYEDRTFDVVISNGAFNLTLSKEEALKEAFRVLRPGGRFMIADMVLVEPLPQERAGKIENWYQ
jgi:SAM-dependent methyltransferase